MTLLQQLDALIELLSPEGAWCQGYYAYTKDGMDTKPCELDACKWCLSGGINKCTQLVRYQDSELYRAIRDKVGAIPTWNDHPDRTQSQVIDMLKEVRWKVFKSEVDQVWSES